MPILTLALLEYCFWSVDISEKEGVIRHRHVQWRYVLISALFSQEWSAAEAKEVGLVFSRPVLTVLNPNLSGCRLPIIHPSCSVMWLLFICNYNFYIFCEREKNLWPIIGRCHNNSLTNNAVTCQRNNTGVLSTPQFHQNSRGEMLEGSVLSQEFWLRDILLWFTQIQRDGPWPKLAKPRTSSFYPFRLC